MELRIFGVLAFLGLATTAQARILDVARYLSDDDRDGIFTVLAEVCPDSFPTVNDHVSRLSHDSALVSLEVFPGWCEQPGETARFVLNVGYHLRQLGLDPQTTKIFIQMQ